ncbi:MAG: hypothetical protein QM691_09120 [Opitutaceae bacterium]
MAKLRSSPAAIKPVQNRSGSWSYRVTVTIAGQQRKQVFQSKEEAEELQETWETERIHGAAAARPKMTSLEKPQIKDAEAAFAVLKPSGLSLLEAAQLAAAFDRSRLQDVEKAMRLADGESFGLFEAVKFAIAHNLRTTDFSNILFDDALAACLKEKKNHISTAHYKRLSQRGRSFGAFIGPMIVRDIPGAGKARPWVESRAMPNGNLTSKCTWNKLVTDLGTIFGFFVKQKWCSTNPFSDIPRYSKKSIGSKQRLRLEVADCATLMAFLEEKHPKWCCYFVLTLLLGVRPDMRTGEIRKLSKCIKRDGVAPYYSNGSLHLSAEITKEREPREVKVSPNVAAWLEKYPLTPENVCPGDYKDEDIRAIRKQFHIAHDGLRHTAISAFMAMPGNSYGEAADQFGNSEPIIKKHYLRRMSLEEGQQFHSIMPKSENIDGGAGGVAAEVVGASA